MVTLGISAFLFNFFVLKGETTSIYWWLGGLSYKNESHIFCFDKNGLFIVKTTFTQNFTW